MITGSLFLKKNTFFNVAHFALLWRNFYAILWLDYTLKADFPDRGKSYFGVKLCILICVWKINAAMIRIVRLCIFGFI